MLIAYRATAYWEFLFLFNMVRTVGLEPTWPRPRDFKSLASTGSATSASPSFQARRISRQAVSRLLWDVGDAGRPVATPEPTPRTGKCPRPRPNLCRKRAHRA